MRIRGKSPESGKQESDAYEAEESFHSRDYGETRDRAKPIARVAGG